MWVKNEKNEYLNLQNGTSLVVKESRDRREYRILSQSVDGTTPLYAVQAGYRSQEEAQDALDELMGSVDGGFLTVTPPSEEEEVDEEEDDTEEGDEN